MSDQAHKYLLAEEEELEEELEEKEEEPEETEEAEIN